jgi:hypothetical protein
MSEADKKKVMWFRGQLFIGAAGSTATTQLTHAMQAKIDVKPTTVETTERGDGTAVPQETQSVVKVAVGISFTMPNRTDDVNLATIRSAAASGTPLAFRGKDHASGKGPDMDCYVEVSEGQPYNGAQTFDITLTPTDDAGRSPQAYV